VLPASVTMRQTRVRYRQCLAADTARGRTMNRVDEIIAELLASTGALGVWLLGRMVVVDNQHQNEVLAGAVKDSSIKPPMKLMIESETYFDFIDRQIFAKRIGEATLLFIFDDKSSLGLIRLRLRQAEEMMRQALAARPS
jgi:hypothetical protein